MLCQSKTTDWQGMGEKEIKAEKESAEQDGPDHVCCRPDHPAPFISGGFRPDMARPHSVRPTHPQTAELPGTLVRCHFSHVALRAAEDGATDLGPHTLTWYLLCTGSGQVLPACQLITGNCDHPRKLPPSMDLSIHPSIQHHNSTSAQGITQFY